MKFIKLSFAALSLALLLGTVVVNADKARTESKGRVDVARLHRFAITEPNAARPELTNGIMTPEFRIRTGLITELDARGFEQVPAEYADFLVTCSVGQRYAVDSNRKSASKHDEVVVEFFDAANKQSLWRGQITAKAYGIDQSGWEVDGTRKLVNQFLKDMGVKLSY